MKKCSELYLYSAHSSKTAAQESISEVRWRREGGWVSRVWVWVWRWKVWCRCGGRSVVGGKGHELEGEKLSTRCGKCSVVRYGSGKVVVSVCGLRRQCVWGVCWCASGVESWPRVGWGGVGPSDPASHPPQAATSVPNSTVLRFRLPFDNLIFDQ